MLSMFLHLVFTLSFVSIALSAPAAPSIDAATLLQNGQDAQILNFEFQQLSPSDACNSGQLACVNGTTAVCQFGSWKLKPCFDSQQCFAVPLLDSRGTRLDCMSEAQARSLIQSAGTKGNIAVDYNNTVAFPTTSLPNASHASTTASHGTGAISSPTLTRVKLVTITVTASASSTPAPTVTLPPTTKTLNSAEFSSLVSSLAGQGAVTVVTVGSGQPLPTNSLPSSSLDGVEPNPTAIPSSSAKVDENSAGGAVYL